MYIREFTDENTGVANQRGMSFAVILLLKFDCFIIKISPITEKGDSSFILTC